MSSKLWTAAAGCRFHVSSLLLEIVSQLENQNW